MEKILNFCGDHYILFTFLALIAIFALIGYFVNMKTKAHQEFKFEKNTDPDFSGIELKDKNASLNEMIFHENNNNNNIPNEEVKTEEKIEENLFDNPGLVVDTPKEETVDSSLFENPGLIVNEPINPQETVNESQPNGNISNDIFGSDMGPQQPVEDIQIPENPENPDSL